ncbi:hypothetical protein [Embleya sp. AB8]|uniref:hypothetical protein n=1 Tax=Embleya sp. AB8 TaxID=3156304 RepID=UPI003C785416
MIGNDVHAEESGERSVGRTRRLLARRSRVLAAAAVLVVAAGSAGAARLSDDARQASPAKATAKERTQARHVGKCTGVVKLTFSPPLRADDQDFTATADATVKHCQTDMVYTDGEAKVDKITGRGNCRSAVLYYQGHGTQNFEGGLVDKVKFEGAMTLEFLGDTVGGQSLGRVDEGQFAGNTETEFNVGTIDPAACQSPAGLGSVELTGIQHALP